MEFDQWSKKLCENDNYGLLFKKTLSMKSPQKKLK